MSYWEEEDGDNNDNPNGDDDNNDDDHLDTSQNYHDLFGDNLMTKSGDETGAVNEQ